MKERCLIWREDDGEESREAVLVRRGDRLCIEEISRGPLTRAMFGASPYGRRIVIEGEFAPAVLAHALYADSTQDLEVVLRQFFQVGGGRLVDIEDALDRENVPYVYAAYTKDEVAFRPAC